MTTTKISENSVVAIHYTLKDDVGEILDSSEGEEPLEYLHGNGGIIPGLETVLEGKEEGEKVSVTVKPEDGYGKRMDELVQKVPFSDFPNADQVKVGAQFHMQSETGSFVATVTEIKDDMVTLDLNHPLADKTLHFDVEIMKIREATKEELEHGHVHSGHHHHH